MTQTTTDTSHDPLLAVFPTNLEGRILFWIAVTFSVFQIVTAAHLVDFSSQVTRAFHVGFLMLLGFPLLALMRGAGVPVRALAWAAALAGVTVALYQWWDYVPLLMRAGDPLPRDIVFGVAALVLVFAAAWAMMGPALPIIAGMFLAYCLFGQHLPSPLNHRGYDFAQVIDHMAYGTEGIYGIPTYVSSTFIFLFILFGAFLEKAGMIRLFTDVSLGLVGHKMGGAAKVSVLDLLGVPGWVPRPGRMMAGAIKPENIRSIGIVAYGRDHVADVSVAALGFV